MVANVQSGANAISATPIARRPGATEGRHGVPRGERAKGYAEQHDAHCALPIGGEGSHHPDAKGRPLEHKGHPQKRHKDIK